MRVIVLNQSDSMRSVLQYVFEQGIDVDIVAETDNFRDLPAVVERFQPDWLFLLREHYTHLAQVTEQLMTIHPDLHILLLSADGQHVGFQQGNAWQTEVETWPEYTLSEFIYMLTTEVLPKRSMESIEDVPTASS